MPISSLIVRTKDKATEQVKEHLKDLKGVSVTDVRQENIVVITETENQTRDKNLWKEIENISGVVQCDLIYHNFEDEEGFDNER